MKKVELSMAEQDKYEAIKRLVDQQGNKKAAAIRLGLSIRQINRLIRNYKEKGKCGFIHGNRSKCPSNKTQQSLSDEIILLYTYKYQGFNYNHFKDKLAEEEGINVSYDYLYRTLMAAELPSPKIHRKTKRILAKEKYRKEHSEISPEEIEKVINHQISIEDSHPRKERCKYFGEMLQMDASQHLWFGETKTQLHLAIDDSTGVLTGGYFDKQETLNGYYNVFSQTLNDYGIPLKFLTDNRTVFNYERNKNKSAEKDVLTQFGYACKTLGTELETTSVPQGKGRIERLFGTLQSRLISELRLHGITDIDEANKFLMETYIPDHNKRFSLPIKKGNNVFETAPNKRTINYTLAVLAPRKIDNGNSIKYKNQYYQPYKNDKIVCFKAHTDCLVIMAFDKQLLVAIDETVYELRKLNTHQRYSINFDVVPEIKETRKPKYIPPMSHPWKAESFRRQMAKTQSKHQYT